MRIARLLTVALTLMVHGAASHAQALRIPATPAGNAEGRTIPPHLTRKAAAFYSTHPAAFQTLLNGLPRAKSQSQAPDAAARTPAAASGPNTWQATAAAPASGLSNPLLLTDGTVIVHVMCSSDWYKLTPNLKGTYYNGSWTKIASLPGNYTPLYFASQILSDGRVIMNGGEYGGNAGDGCSADWGTSGAIYDPVANNWASVTPPSGWSNIGDAQSIILFNSKYMLANCCSRQEAILDPSTMAWTSTGSGKADENDEEGWTFLPNGRVLTVDAYANSGTCGTNSEIYFPSSGSWQTAGSTIYQMSDCGSGQTYEVGPMVLRADGTVVAFSGLSTGDPAGISIFSSSTMTWATSNHVPYVNGQNLTLADAPATIMPDGNVVFAASPGAFKPPTTFFKLYGDTNGMDYLPSVPNAGSNSSYVYNMLTLPTGQVLMTDFSNVAYIYTPATTTQVSAAVPTIKSVATTLIRGKSYSISGTNLSGVTHGNYGDDQQAATNFPIVRALNTTTRNYYYLRTHDFTRRTVTPGTLSGATFDVDGRLDPGTYTLYVIANGVHSSGINVTVK